MKGSHFIYSILLTVSLGMVALGVYRSSLLNQKVKGANTSTENPEIKGLILPHHDLARQYIIETLDTVTKNNNYKTIVIFGPNHFHPEMTVFVTSHEVLDYHISQKAVEALLSSEKNVVEDKSIVENEHSFKTPTTYLRNYFPDAQFVPLVVPQNFNRETISKLAAFFAGNSPGETLYVASVDFSHDNTVLPAEEKNKESEKAIENFDFDKIYNFKSDNLDSPASIGLLLNTMQDLGSTKWQLLYDSHSSFIEGDPVIEGTSYVTGTFSK